jgi:hypothetical protein
MASWRHGVSTISASAMLLAIGIAGCASMPAKPAGVHAPRWRGDFETGNLLQWSYLLNPRGLLIVDAPVPNFVQIGILRDVPAAPEVMYLDDAIEDADFAPDVP